MNETSAKEWLEKSWHNLSGAKILYNAKHYTDIITVELHYSVEKTLKTFLAYNNQKIPKTHDLINVYKLIKNYINLDDDLEILKQITRYHIEESYPAFHRELPPKKEIKKVLDFTKELFDKACAILDIDKDILK